MKPVAQPPFYAAEIRPAIVCLTSTGLRVDRDMHVLDCADRPIGGLFSAGEVSGGVLGDRYIGGGNSIANAIVFGRVAGEQAAREAGLGTDREIGRASCRERVWQYVEISVVAVSLKKKNHKKRKYTRQT